MLNGGVTAGFRGLSLKPYFVLQSAYRDRDTILLVMGVGTAVVLLAVGLIVLGFENPAQNVILLVSGWFLLIMGITAFVIPLTAFSRWDRLPVLKVRCRQCSTLNYESAMRCRNCGTNMFSPSSLGPDRRKLL